MKHLSEYIHEQLDKNWTDDVKTHWEPVEGLFTWKDPKRIAEYLLKNSDDRAQAMRRLVFYMNRAGDGLENKTVLNKAKELLKESIDESASKFLVNKKSVESNRSNLFNDNEKYKCLLFFSDTRNSHYIMVITNVELHEASNEIIFTLSKETSGYRTVLRRLKEGSSFAKMHVRMSPHSIMIRNLNLIGNVSNDRFIYSYESLEEII